MSFPNSPGVYDRIVDQSYFVSAAGIMAGGIVLTANRGTLEMNTVTSTREFTNEYGLPDRDNPALYSAIRFLGRTGILTVKRIVNDAVAAEGKLVDGSDDHLIVTAENPGSWGNNVTVSFAEALGEPATNFNLVVKENGLEVERFLVSRDPDAKDGYGSNLFIEDVVNQRSKVIRVEDNPTVTDPYDPDAVITLSGGTDDTSLPTSGGFVLAWDEFLDVEQVPANLLINGGYAVPEIQHKMLAVAQARRDAVAILDVPKAINDDVEQMIEYRKTTLGANTFYGGIYGGWIRAFDPYQDREVEIPPSGDVAGVFAYTVEVANRWDAPAGVRRGIIPNALGVTKVFTEGERDLLYTNGVNPVTTYAGSACIIWGQKTCQVQDSALNRFNVVNSVLWLNARMKTALVPFVFEANTAFTRDNAKAMLETFLEHIQAQGGLYGFYVDTSEAINTPFVIDNNQMLIDVYIKPVRAAEFIRLSTIITPTGATFTLDA